MQPRKHYRHIIWDWNGTLFDDAWLCMDITNGLLRPRGLELLTPERYQDLFDFPVRLYYERLGFDLEAESFETLGSEFITAYDTRRFECKLQPEARVTLEALATAGFTQSVLSAYQHRSLQEIIDHFDMRRYFTELIGIDDHYATGKVEQGKRWITQLHCPPAEVLLVGDTLHDDEVAREMGTDCVLIPSGHHSREKLSTCAAPLYNDLSDFRDWLLSI